MTAAWLCAHPGGVTAHDTESAAEAAAMELLRSGRAKEATWYRVEVEDEEMSA